MKREDLSTDPNTPASDAPLLGIDVGGTKILGGLVSRQGEVLFQHQVPTRRLRLLEDIVAVAEILGTKAGGSPHSIGVGVTGYVDRGGGVLAESMNMGIADIRIRQALAEHTGLTAHVENDVHAATVGEIHFGVGRSHKDFLLFNAGTGLATGLVFDGRLHRGASNYAGENGHISVDQSGTTTCRCGLSGCTEALLLAARRGIDTPPAFLPKVEPPPSKEYGYLALNLIQLINLLNPSAIVLAGGMLASDPAATDWVRRAAQAHALPNALRGLDEISLSRTAPYTGLVGAAALTLEPQSSGHVEA